jgi:glycosyltransferase involved in cell wall biosynthesis
VNSISVIIPAYNHEAYLAETIQSVLAQTCPPDEIIVVDDGSADGTAEVARSHGKPVRCICQENQGLGGSRNRGLREARGSLIAFLDSDDLWLERKLELQSAYLAAHPETDMVFCRMKNFLSAEIDPANALKFDPRELPACNTGSLLARREAFDRAGLFPTERDAQEFFHWFVRACDAGVTYHILPELLLLRRVHLTNTVHDPAYKSRYFRFLKEHLDRNRASAGAQP